MHQVAILLHFIEHQDSRLRWQLCSPPPVVLSGFLRSLSLCPWLSWQSGLRWQEPSDQMTANPAITVSPLYGQLSHTNLTTSSQSTVACTLIVSLRKTNNVFHLSAARFWGILWMSEIRNLFYWLCFNGEMMEEKLSIIMQLLAFSLTSVIWWELVDHEEGLVK